MREEARGWRLGWVCVGVALLLGVLGGRAHAHPLSPSLLEIRELADGRAEVTWKTPLRRAPGVRVNPVLPEACRVLGPASTTDVEPDSVTVQWTVDCGASGLVGRRIGVSGLADSRTDALVRVTLADGRLVRSVLRAREPFLSVPEASAAVAPRGTADAPRRAGQLGLARGYAAIGVDHILTGLDHLLFVFGLLLLVSGGRRLLATITAFTLGHSVTLAIAVLGIAMVPARLVEVLIALSIFVLAVELARERAAQPSLLRRLPWLMAFVFGLLHGLGFAGALTEVGLPPGEIPLALVSFNVGIELGQLAFVAAVLLLGLVLSRLGPPLPAWSRQVPVYAMGSLAWFWCLQRALGAV